MTYEEALVAANANNDLDNSTFVIDKNLRTIAIPSSFVLGVYNDKNTQIIPFAMPRYYNDIDLSEFTIRVNFLNAHAEGDIYLVYGQEVGEDTITFDWIVNRPAYAYAGDVSFVVCMRLVDENNIVIKEYNTTISHVPVLQGIEVENPISENIVADLLAQIQACETRAEVASLHYPTIIDGYWYVWDVTTGQFVTTGTIASGVDMGVSYDSSAESLTFTPQS